MSVLRSKQVQDHGAPRCRGGERSSVADHPVWPGKRPQIDMVQFGAFSTAKGREPPSVEHLVVQMTTLGDWRSLEMNFEMRMGVGSRKEDSGGLENLSCGDADGESDRTKFAQVVVWRTLKERAAASSSWRVLPWLVVPSTFLIPKSWHVGAAELYSCLPHILHPRHQQLFHSRHYRGCLYASCRHLRKLARARISLISTWRNRRKALRQ